MPGVTRTPTAPGRTPEQRLRALTKANEVRVARAQPKREVAAGRIELARVVAVPPTCAQTAKVRVLLLVVPRTRSRPGRSSARPLPDRPRKDDPRPQRPSTGGTGRAARPLSVPGSRRPGRASAPASPRTLATYATPCEKPGEKRPVDARVTIHEIVGKKKGRKEKAARQVGNPHRHP